MFFHSLMSRICFVILIKSLLVRRVKITKILGLERAFPTLCEWRFVPTCRALSWCMGNSGILSRFSPNFKKKCHMNLVSKNRKFIWLQMIKHNCLWKVFTSAVIASWTKPGSSCPFITTVVKNGQSQLNALQILIFFRPFSEISKY